VANVLLISRYYPPEVAAAAVCVSETAKRLATCGHRVTVLTTLPHHPTGIVPPEYRGFLSREEMIDGVRVVRVWSYASANVGFFRRILSQFSFGCLAPILARKKLGHPDVIIVESPPLPTVIAARILARREHCPFIFWVADLWPEAAVQLGRLRDRRLVRLAEWLEASTYRHAAMVWVVSQGLYEFLVRRGFSPTRLFVLPNGVDAETFRPLPRAASRAELDWDDRFTVLYAGAHGPSHALTTILDAADRLRLHRDIRFVFVGAGAEKADLVAQARRRQLDNVTFLDPVPHDRMPVLLAAADVCVAHMRRLAVFEANLPIKMYEAMACGRPLLLALNGNARDMAVRDAGAALHVEPEDAEAFASAVKYLRDHPAEAEQLGLRGRRYIEGRFDYDTLTQTADRCVRDVLRESQTANADH